MKRNRFQGHGWSLEIEDLQGHQRFVSQTQIHQKLFVIVFLFLTNEIVKILGIDDWLTTHLTVR
jgi:hypothetical protein